MKLTSRLSISVVLAAVAASAQNFASFPQYTPHAHVTGTLVVWGNDGMVALAKRWEDGFRKYQPDIRFEDHLYSTAAGIGGLYAGHADLAYMGRDIWPVESLGFSKTFGYEPTRFVAATGAYDVEGKTFPMVVFVTRTTRSKVSPCRSSTPSSAQNASSVPQRNSDMGRPRPHRGLGRQTDSSVRLCQRQRFRRLLLRRRDGRQFQVELRYPPVRKY